MATKNGNGEPDIAPGNPTEIPPEEIPVGIPPTSPVENPAPPGEVPPEPPLEVPPPSVDS